MCGARLAADPEFEQVFFTPECTLGCSFEGEIKKGSHSTEGRINSNWVLKEGFKESQCLHWDLEQE